MKEYSIQKQKLINEKTWLRYLRLKPWYENSFYELRSAPFGLNSICPRASSWTPPFGLSENIL